MKVLVMLIFLSCINCVEDVNPCQVIVKNDLIDLKKCSNFELFKTSNLFLLGETHNKKSNNFVWLKMIKSFNHEYGLTDVIIEDSPAKAYLLNQYLHSSDLKISDFIFYGNNEKKIYNELKRKFKSNEINIHGVDSEDDYNLLIYAFSMVLKKYDKHTFSNNNFLQKLVDSEYFEIRSKEEAYRVLNKLKSICKNDVKFLERLRKDDLILFKRFIESYDKMCLYEGIDFNQCFNIEKIEDREEYLAYNVAYLLSHNPGKKFFGQFGSTHVPLTTKGKNYFRNNCDITWNSMASRLNQLKVNFGQIISMQLIYDDKNYSQEYREWGLTEDLVKANFSKLNKSELLILENTKIDSSNIDLHYLIFTK